MSESDDEEKSVVSFEAKKRGDALFRLPDVSSG